MILQVCHPLFKLAKRWVGQLNLREAQHTPGAYPFHPQMERIPSTAG